MAVLSRDDYFQRLHDRLGDDTSDECISFLEDMTDTYNDLEQRTNGDGIDWKQKYHDLDESWKKRYRHRFFTGTGGNYTPVNNGSDSDDDGYDPDSVTVESLFE